MGFVLLWVGMITLVLCMGTGMRLCMCMFMLSNQTRNGVFLLNIEDILRELLVKILDVLMPYQFPTIIHSHPLHLDSEAVVGI